MFIMAVSPDDLEIDRSRGGRFRIVPIVWLVVVLAVLVGGVLRAGGGEKRLGSP